MMVIHKTEYYITIKNDVEKYLIKCREGQGIPLYGWPSSFNQNSMQNIIPVFVFKN